MLRLTKSNTYHFRDLPSPWIICQSEPWAQESLRSSSCTQNLAHQNFDPAKAAPKATERLH